jgi:hypothetical protein
MSKNKEPFHTLFALHHMYCFNIRHEVLIKATSKKRWDGHVVQMEEIGNPLRVLILNPYIIHNFEDKGAE